MSPIPDEEQAAALFRRGLKQVNIQLSEQQVAELVCYSLELSRWNRKVNLVSKNASFADIVAKHFLDSLSLAPVLDRLKPPLKRLLDVGSGAGFPGLVLKIVRPEYSVVLLEPRQRRVAFLNHVIRTLRLTDIAVLPCRTDEEQAMQETPYGIITGRAVTDVHSFLDMIENLADPDTLVACMQGRSGVKQWRREQDNPGYAPVCFHETVLPLSEGQRFILVFRKRQPEVSRS